MFRLVLLTVVWAGANLVTQVHAAVPRTFCSDISRYVTARNEQQPATQFCSSYLALSTISTSQTVTATQTVSTTTTATVTTTTATTVATVTPVTVTTIVDVTSTSTITDTQSITTSIVTYTDYTTTQTETDTTTTTLQSTTTTTSTTTVDLTNCASPTTTMAKRTLRDRNQIPTPGAFSQFTNSASLSQACSCLSIPQQTSTLVMSTTTTTTATQTDTYTVTQTSSVTATARRATTTTETSTNVVIQTTTTTVFVLSTSTLSTGTTTTTTATVTTTQTSTLTAAATRYKNFALLASNTNKYGLTKYTGASGNGIYFSGANLATAATFSFTGTNLYYDNQFLQSYLDTNSFDYYASVDRPDPNFGYATGCTLSFDGPSGGCPVKCIILYSPIGYANNDYSYGGAWGFSGARGTPDEFVVYAVGQT